MHSFIEDEAMRWKTNEFQWPGSLQVLPALLLGFFVTASPLAAQEHPKVVLVELFTSEGCSSCPPADALLKQVNGSRTASGQLIVGISEHVTYWNSLGWADPFSSPVYTERQNAYGAGFGLDSVYTPQMVVNGRQQFVGSDRARLEQAIRAERDQPQPLDLRILETSVAGGSLMVKFSTAGDNAFRGADIVAVLADDVDQSSVLRGENSGRNLTHVSVARSLTKVAKFQSAGEQTVQLPLPGSFNGGSGHHLILFAQARGNGRVLGADSRSLTGSVPAGRIGG
jgi:hypothetical protein